MVAVAGSSVIITGAANGVGLAAARKFADAGARLVLADFDDAKLKSEAANLRAAGAEVAEHCCDLRQKLSVRNLLALAVDSFERVDILVNAARQVLPTDPLDEDDTSLDTLMEQNVLSALRLSRGVARQMIQQSENDPDSKLGVGSIVNLTSISARRTSEELFALSVSSAALDQMTRSLAATLAPHGIRVNAVALGGVMTAHLREALQNQDDLRKEMTSVTPLARIGEATEAADAILFLASGAASFVTGQILAVDGGRTVLDPLTVAPR